MPNRHHSNEGVVYLINCSMPTLSPHKTPASMLKSQILCFHSPPGPQGDEIPSGEGLHSVPGGEWARAHAFTMSSLNNAILEILDGSWPDQ